MNADAPNIGVQLASILERLRKRQAPVALEEIDKAVATFAGIAEHGVINDWLTGWWHLSRYEHRAAFNALRQAHDAVAALAWAAPASARLFELSFDVRMALIEAHMMLTDFDAAHAQAAILVDESRSTDDRQRKGQALSWLGSAQLQLGRVESALKSLTRARGEFEAAQCTAQTSRVLNDLGVVYQGLGDFPRALDYYQQALTAAIVDGDADMEGRALAHRGAATIAQGKSDAGVAIMEQAILVLDRIGAFWHSGWCMQVIGKANADRGEYPEALARYTAALKAVRRAEAPQIEAAVLAGLGELQGKMGDYGQAQETLGQALEIAMRTSVDREIFKTHQLLAELHKRFGNDRLALLHFEQFHQIKSKLFDDLALAKVTQIENEFDIERARRDRELFQLRNVELVSAMEVAKRLNAELAEKAAALQEMSNHEPLTGLYNRRFLYRRLEEEIQRYLRHGSRFSVAIYDIDDFKHINDSCSQLVGDQVLQEVANVVGGALRQPDVHVRYGGDEFAIIFPEAPLAAATAAMEKLRERVAAHDWSRIAPGVSLTISAGVVEVGEGESMEPLLVRVEAKMLEARKRRNSMSRKGRNPGAAD